MASITLTTNQTYLDAAIAAFGTLEGAMALMRHNDLSLTSMPEAGTVLGIPTDAPTEVNALQYLQRNSTAPGTRGTL